MCLKTILWLCLREKKLRRGWALNCKTFLFCKEKKFEEKDFCEFFEIFGVFDFSEVLNLFDIGSGQLSSFLKRLQKVSASYVY